MENLNLFDIEEEEWANQLTCGIMLSQLNNTINHFNQQRKLLTSIQHYFTLQNTLFKIQHDYQTLLKKIHQQYYGFLARFMSLARFTSRYRSLSLFSKSLTTEATWLVHRYALLISYWKKQHYYSYQLLEESWWIECNDLAAIPDKLPELYSGYYKLIKKFRLNINFIDKGYPKLVKIPLQ